MARRRKAPDHILSPFELRRREDRQARPKWGEAMAAWHPARVHGPWPQERDGEPFPVAHCLLCGRPVVWSTEWRSGAHARDLDGDEHRATCQARGGSMTLTITPGPRNAHTDPDSGLRFYRWQGRDLPSVTSIRRMAGLPFGLHHWTIGKVIDAAMQSASAIIAAGDDEGSIALLRHELRRAATAERDAAATLGTAIHDAAAAGREPEDVPEELRPRLRQYRAWLATSGAEVLASEFQVFSLTEGYAGTADLLVRLRDGRIWLVDIKTGKGIYAEHALQVIAYAQAEFVGADDVVDEKVSGYLYDVSGLAILHLADDRWEFEAVRYDDETWQAFRGLLRFATWTHAHQGVGTFTVAHREGSTP